MAVSNYDKQHDEIYDLLIVADATASMYEYLSSLRISLPQIISVSALTNCFSRIGLMYYRDYDQESPVEWHGWVDPAKTVDVDSTTQEGQQQRDLVSIAENVKAIGGGDFPEAIKTALAKVYEVSRAEATTIVLLYTDAPPHMSTDGDRGNPQANYTKEKQALEDCKSYGGHGPKFVDWVSACKTLRDGGKRIITFSMVSTYAVSKKVDTYNYLSTITGGACICLLANEAQPMTVSRLTVELLLAWMGVEKAGLSFEAKHEKLGAMLTRYITISGIEEVEDEESGFASVFFNSVTRDIFGTIKSNNTTQVEVTPETLKEYLPKKKTPVTELIQQWKEDPHYRKLAIVHLERIIQHDVRAIFLNPVLGSLWRVFCSDRTIPNRDAILAAFSQRISKIPKQKEKEQMKNWLEESYDFTAKIQDIIETVPEDERFPCVYLDPTLRFERAASGYENDQSDNRPITEFRRDELLEIGRSSSEMPEHIAETTNTEVPKIPVALASQKYKREFWNILLHTVLPGTMLADRPAAVLAALSLRMGVEPLTDAAEQQMLAWKSKWNDIEVPETWNVGCLTLLLDADKAYRQRRENLGQKDLEGLLHNDDRNLFEALMAFKILERNLDTPLMAKVGWTPNKTLAPLGPVATCRTCQFPRSVTIMGESGKCGLCLSDDYKSDEERFEYVNSYVSKDDNESTSAAWVECSVPTCRAQYILYHPHTLNMRAKCHYCRSQTGSAPTVECIKCLNRVIYPQSYRPSTFSESDFLCTACTSSRETISEIETTARQISRENTTDWLAIDTESRSKTPFSGRSVHYTITTIGTKDFMSRIKLFPDTHSPLRRRGKIIRNPQELIDKLQKQISQRHAERVPCSLCFSNYQPRYLNAACGRRGCFQRICRGCLDGWYGLNSAGCIINTASLFCPFCRRQPQPRTLAKHGMGVHAVGNLAQAVQDQGRWIYAWCQSCAHAKRYVERVCARGVPDDIQDWDCDECREQQELEEARRLEEIERLWAVAQTEGDVRAAERLERMRARLRRDKLKRIDESRKPCPGCGVMCEKTMGCGHITCPIPECQTHWCYFCGKKFDQNKIYKHMRDEHGGLYGAEDLEYDDELYD